MRRRIIRIFWVLFVVFWGVKNLLLWMNVCSFLNQVRHDVQSQEDYTSKRIRQYRAWRVFVSQYLAITNTFHVNLGKGPCLVFGLSPPSFLQLFRLANKTQAARAISKYNNRVPRLLEKIFVLSLKSMSSNSIIMMGQEDVQLFEIPLCLLSMNYSYCWCMITRTAVHITTMYFWFRTTSPSGQFRWLGARSLW